jgi:18S rRNA (guanine1575-N7)-methyltransferase
MLSLGRKGESSVFLAALVTSPRSSQQRRPGRKERVAPKSVDWIKKKKEKHRRLGKEVKNDSKYSGRRRPTAF